jgi:Flavin containing amine oxidoreductase
MADRPADPPRARSDPCGHSLRAMPTLTRREFTLSASALAAATLLSGCGGGSDTDGEHVVVVHGIAGLAAARRLADEGVRVTVLEARERIGGQVWTCEVRFKIYEAGYETPLRQTGMPWVTTTLRPPGRSVAPCPPTKRSAWRHSPVPSATSSVDGFARRSRDEHAKLLTADLAFDAADHAMQVIGARVGRARRLARHLPRRTAVSLRTSSRLITSHSTYSWADVPGTIRRPRVAAALVGLVRCEAGATRCRSYVATFSRTCRSCSDRPKAPVTNESRSRPRRGGGRRRRAERDGGHRGELER